MIAAGDHWLLLAVLLLAAWAGVALERTRWGARISGAVISILVTFLLSNAGLIPAAAPVYDAVWGYLVPLAIPLLLFAGDLRRIVRDAGPTLGAFVVGGLGTVAGTLLAFRLVPLGTDGWRVAGIFCATYIGGSMNYAGAAEALGLRSGNLLTAGVAADNLMMTVYFLVLFALPSWSALGRRFARRVVTAGEGEAAGETGGDGPQDAPAASVTLPVAAAALGVAAAACAAGQVLERALAVRGSAILAETALVVVAATLAPALFRRLGGAELLGALLMQVFFAAIGASANIAVVLRVGPVLFLFAGVILAVHLAVLLLGGWALRLDLAEVVIASNANMGGPTTAAAMASARRWPSLVLPAILCGTLGYATATFIGVAVGHWLHHGA